MSHLDEEFDLDVRLHGMPLPLRAQPRPTQEEACSADECPRPNTEDETCDGLAFTCNSCEDTCAGPTFCGDTCDPAQTCRSCDCQTLRGCPTHGCLTDETCDQQVCADPTMGCGEEEETDDTCGCPSPPGEGPEDPDPPGPPKPGGQPA